MCEVFGVSSPEPVKLNDLLREFFSHSDAHPDGWGLAFFYGNNEVSLEKQPLNALRSLYLKSRLKAPIEACSMFAHIRLATKGSVEYENTHPFTGRDDSGRNWTLAHNGTIFESNVLDPMFYAQQGHTDSERILLYLIKKMNEAGAESLGSAERFRIADRVLTEITPENKVNLLLYDGELMYVHTNYPESLYMRKEGNGRIFSTRPLDRKEWEPVPMTTLLAFRQGELLYTGTNHGNIFVDTPSKFRHLYLDYAVL